MKRIAEFETSEALGSDSELFDRLLDIVEQEHLEDDFDNFVRLFRRPGGETIRRNQFPKPIRNLISWHNKFPDKIYVIRTPEEHLELCIDRVALIVHDVDVKIMQNFERCLISVKPALMVLESTHSKDVPSKRYGFRDCHALFGTSRVVITEKEKNYWHRRPSKALRLKS